MAAKNKPNEIYITRVYDAPVKAVWDAWTDPKQAAKWWGPRGFTITTHSKDLRVGGNWHYTMHGPDGTDYPNKTIYLEVENHKRLVYDHGGYDDRPPLFRVTVNFSETKGKTTMDMTMSLATPEAAKEIKSFIKQAGGNSTWDRLAEYLEKESSGEEHFVINRSFEAPINTVFEMWTNPKHFENWLGPTGSVMTFLRPEIKEGGVSFYEMSTSEGVMMYGRMYYRKIIKPTYIEYAQEFTDKNEKQSRHPFAPTWPAMMITKVTLTEESENQTRVTVDWTPFGDFTKEEMQTFIDARAGMTGGWTGSFDKLEEYLEKK